MDLQAIIISVGSELTTGQTLDTNSQHIALRLGQVGAVCIAHYVVDDHVGRVSAALTAASEQADLLIVSGGLGPTADDVTRDALAAAMNVELELDEACLADISAFFHLRGREMNPNNRLQAMVPRGARAIPNAMGTAPGLHGRLGRAEVFVVPGVPVEMRNMLDRDIMPAIARRTGGSPLAVRKVNTFGAGESDVAARIADLMGRESNPLVGTTVASGLVTVRIIAKSQAGQAAADMAEQMVQLVRGRLGQLAFGMDEETMATVVGRLLRKHGRTLAVAESCTGGLLGQLVSEVSGSSEYFVGGAITYSNRLKEQLLGVPGALIERHGAVSQEVALAMAQGAQKAFGTDYALSITGIAGPTGGSSEKPVGLVYTAMAGPDGACALKSIFAGDREAIRLRAALTALNMLRTTDEQ